MVNWLHNMTTLTPVQQKFVDDFAADPDVQKMVAEIEAKPATTQHRYGDYGAKLSGLSQGNKTIAQLLALAFVKAGGNYIGVNNGLNTLVLGKPPIGF